MPLIAGQQILAFYSAGGYARENHLPFELAHASASANPFEIVFIEDDPSLAGTLIHGRRVVSYETAKDMRSERDLRMNVAFASPQLRRAKMEQALNDGFDFFDAIAPSACFGPNVAFGRGAIFSSNTIVTSDARIGIGFHCNIYSYVAHDCIVGDYVTFAPRVSLNGRIKVEDDVYVGSDATFLPGKADRFLTIGRGAVIGAGAAVTKDVEPGDVVVGNPAKPLRR